MLELIESISEECCDSCYILKLITHFLLRILSKAIACELRRA